MNQDELNRILELHEKWIKGEDGCVRANLRHADLRNADLSGANLSGANLRHADLSGANLRHADLSGANLRHADLRNADLSYANLSDADLSDANLRHADLRNADLSYANLSDADLSGANLSDADLRNADLSDADLSGANLRHADLRNADLSDADLSGANLSGANLSGADLSGACLDNVKCNDATAFYHLQCPEEGSYIAYKKGQEGRIIKLLIPEDAKRSSATTRKCRASKAKVLSITNINGTENFEETISFYNHEFIYKVGETVEVKDFDKNRWNECSTGIHHFITRDEAVNYHL